MTSLVQISEEDPWVAAAGYVGTILEQLEERSEAAKGDSEKFVQDVEIAYGKEDLSQVLDLFLSKLDIVFKNADNEQDLEGITNIICHLVPRIEPPESDDAVARVSKALSSDPETRPERRLQGLINLYNTVLDSPAKYQALMKTIEFSKASGLADIMLGVIKTKIDSWITVLSLSDDDARALYLNCADSLTSCTRKPKSAAKEAYKLRMKALRTYTQDTSSEGTDVAAQVVSEYIASSDLLTFDLLDTPAVQSLKTSSKYKNLYTMLNVLLHGSVKEFRDFVSTPDGSSVITSVGTTEQDLTNKILLLALAGFVHGRTSVPCKEISEALDIPASDVEDLIVRAIGKRVMEAKIDQLQETILISRCSSRTFENNDWQNLQKDLKQWRKSIADVLALGSDTKSVLTQGLGQLQQYA